VREERIVLEHGVDVAPVGRNTLRRGAEDFDVPGGRLLETGDEPEAGRLAGARRAEQREEFSLGDLERDIVDGAHMPKWRLTCWKLTAVVMDILRCPGMAAGTQ
jgi:hypothetical protein